MVTRSQLCLRFRPLAIVVIAIGATTTTQWAAAESCTAFDSEIVNEASSELIVGQITIRTGDLFNLNDPTQDQFVHSAANSLHLVTREKTIADALPFRSGDVFSVDLLTEGERTLREKRYLRDATVVPHRICANRVDVEVRTIDNWTLTPSVSFGSAGGENRYSFEIQDLNVLGLGKELKVRQSRNDGEKSSAFLYGDDNVWGSRHRLRLELGDTDDGEQYFFQGGLPFYTNKAQRSWWVSLKNATNAFDAPSDSRITIPVKSEQASIKFAKALTQSTLPYARVGGGVRFSRQVTELPVLDRGIESANDFEELYPFITAQWSRSDWAKRQNYKSLRANEDIDLGLGVDLELGLVLGIFGNDEDAVRLGIGITKGWYSGKSALHKLNYHQTNYFGSNDESKYALSARYQYFRWIGSSDQLDLRLTGETRRGYSPLYDYSVGGDEGLRAYRTEYERGEQRLVGVAEYRHITQWSPWSLVNTAFTTFVEVGRAWSDGDDADTLADIGVGLLLSPTRSSRAAINRFDISVPLVDGEGVADYQIFIGTKINY
jgi:outer membrane protein assembly factor BamA